MISNDDVFRRAVLNLVRLLSNEFEATYIFVAEERYTTNQTPIVNLLQYTTHGALRPWRERKGSEYRRFINVMKMRGVAHDDRNYETAFCVNVRSYSNSSRNSLNRGAVRGDLSSSSQTCSAKARHSSSILDLSAFTLRCGNGIFTTS